MRYYLGVDWADQTHAVWVVDERGMKITARAVTEARTGELWALLRQPQVPVPAHVGRAKARLMRTLVEQLMPVVAAVAQYRKAIDDFFASMPAAQWVRTLPIGKHGITAPTLWARLGDAPGRWESFRHLQAQAGTVPVTKRSGKATTGHSVPLRLRQGVAVRGRSGGVPLDALE